MFSNTAYEAVYQYLGLELQSRFIQVITSQKVFLAAIVMIFGIMFFLDHRTILFEIHARRSDHQEACCLIQICKKSSSLILEYIYFESTIHNWNKTI